MYEKKGYLESPYRLFYLKTTPKEAIGFHYHDFHKLVILLGGHIGYAVEGQRYDLSPGAVVLVGAGQIHCPIFYDDSSYERLILYLAQDVGQVWGQEGACLLACFGRAREEGAYLFSPREGEEKGLWGIYESLVKVMTHPGEPYMDLLERAKVAELLISINTSLLKPGEGLSSQSGQGGMAQKCIAYVNAHLREEELSVEGVAKALYLSKSYCMHRFKEETGYTLGEYIREKRLFLARGLLAQGLSANEACYQSGFRNYSAFYYAYKKRYQVPPTLGTGMGELIGGDA